MAEKDFLILLTNDDGVEAIGLRAMREALSQLGRVVVVAPSEERSAVSHALTIHHPIRINEIAEDLYSVSGTPVDCVIFGLRKILPRFPDLVVSGINHGPNLGDDILYSGTVGAAREAALYRLPSLAVSLVTRRREDFSPAAGLMVRLIEEMDPATFSEGTFLNINIPDGVPHEHRFTRQGSKRVSSVVEEKEDPRGRTYYWIGLDQSEWLVEADTDYQAIRDGVISITPLHRDQTDYRALRSLRDKEQKDPSLPQKRGGR